MGGLRCCLALVALAGFSPRADARPLFGNAPIDEAAALLRPGQYVLNDAVLTPGFQALDFPTDAPITIGVSIALQRLYVYRGDTLIAVSTVSTGKPGHRTPMGDFTILQKRRWHRSNIYSNAPMPFMQRLTWTGIAIHAGHDPGFPASHGCIRIPLSFAQTLFGMTNIGEAVVVTDYPLHTPVELEVAWSDLAGDEGVRFERPRFDSRNDKARDGPVWLEYDARVFAITSGR